MPISNVSVTDLECFARTANPVITNLERLREDLKDESTIEDITSQLSDEASLRSKSVTSASDHSGLSAVSTQQSRKSSKTESTHSRSSRSSKHTDRSSNARSSQHNSLASQSSQKSVTDSSRSSPKSSKTSTPNPNQKQNSHKARYGAFETYVSKHNYNSDEEPARINSHELKKNNECGYKPYASKHNKDELDYLEKQTVLLDLERLRLQGVSLSKTWSMDDRVEDMQFEVKRHLMHVEEMNTVTMMRDGMRMACTMVEMFNNRVGVLDMRGWSAEICSDMQKYDSALSRLYKKYWRKTQSSSPEMEIIIGVIGSLGMYHFKQRWASAIVNDVSPVATDNHFQIPSGSDRKGHTKHDAYQVDDTSDEEAPP